MQFNIKIRFVICGLLLLGGANMFAQSFGFTSSWGNNGLANDYYYGDTNPFQMDDNMFTYGNTATQNMRSTSSTYSYSGGTFTTAASSLGAGSTLADYAAGRVGRTRGRDDHLWETDDQAPIGDGLWVLLLLALGYGVCVYRRLLRCKKSDRCAVRS